MTKVLHFLICWCAFFMPIPGRLGRKSHPAMMHICTRGGSAFHFEGAAENNNKRGHLSMWSCACSGQGRGLQCLGTARTDKNISWLKPTRLSPWLRTRSASWISSPLPYRSSLNSTLGRGGTGQNGTANSTVSCTTYCPTHQDPWPSLWPCHTHCHCPC